MTAMVMEIDKCSERTLRSPRCECGRLDLYIAHPHDSDGSGSEYCDRCKSYRDVVLIDRAGNIHDCTGKPKPAYDAPSASPKPAAGFGGASAKPDAFGAFQAFLDLIAPKVDADQVEKIIDAKLAGLIMPTQVQITRPDGEVKTITGAHEALARVLRKYAAGIKAGIRIHVMMVGPAGTGKTHIGEQVADALGLQFYPVQCGPTTTESKLLGGTTANGFEPGLVYHAAKFGGLLLLDEVDNGHPAVLNVLNALLANGKISFANGEVITVHKDCLVLCGANTYGNGPDRQYVGRQALDQAFLDRFTMVDVNYDLALEESLCRATGASDSVVSAVLAYVRGLRANALREKLPRIMGMRASVGACAELAGEIPVSEVVHDRIRHGMSDADWSKVNSGVSPLRF